MNCHNLGDDDRLVHFGIKLAYLAATQGGGLEAWSVSFREAYLEVMLAACLAVAYFGASSTYEPYVARHGTTVMSY
jgi:hypothetical protein